MSTHARPARVVAVTGACGEIGRATARAFATSRTTLVLMAGQGAGPGEGGDLVRVADEVCVAGGTAVVLPLDVGDPSAVGAAVDRVESEVGPIDVWVNAPVSPDGADRSLSASEYRRLAEIGYLGCVYTTKAVIEPMMARDRGTVVQVSECADCRSAADGPSSTLGAEQAIQSFHGSLVDELVRRESHVHLAIIEASVQVHEPDGVARAVVDAAAQALRRGAATDVA